MMPRDHMVDFILHFTSRNRISICDPGCPKICYADQAGLELAVILLPLLAGCRDKKVRLTTCRLLCEHVFSFLWGYTWEWTHPLLSLNGPKYHQNLQTVPGKMANQKFPLCNFKNKTIQNYKGEPIIQGEEREEHLETRRGARTAKSHEEAERRSRHKRGTALLKPQPPTCNHRVTVESSGVLWKAILVAYT